MVRQVQPWFENLAKRQVKAPKIYLRDTGILHSLLSAGSEDILLSHPRVGASWEVTRSMHNIVQTLHLDHLFVVFPSRASCPVPEHISVLSVFDCADLGERIESA